MTRIALAILVASSATPALAQSSLSRADPRPPSAGFLSIPQVTGRGYIVDASILTSLDSNFRRTGTGESESAFRVSPLAEAGIGTMIGRQQLFVGGSFGRDFFINNSQFNRNRFSMGAGTNLVVGTRCTANVGSEYSQRQLLQADAVELADNSLSTFLAGAGFNCQGPVGIGFGVTTLYNQTRNARLERQLFDFDGLTVSPQISYASPVLGVFSFGASFSNFKYPNRFVLTPDGLVDDEIDIRSWRLGYSRSLGTRFQVTLGLSDFSSTPMPGEQLLPRPGGPLGAFDLVERPQAGGLGYDASLTAQLGSRASITASANRQLRGGGNVGALATRSQIYALDANYSLSSSLSAGAGAMYTDLDFFGSFASIDEPLARQATTVQRYYGQLNYSPGGRYSVGFEVAHQRRQSDPQIFAFSNTSALLRLSVQFGRQ